MSTAPNFSSSVPAQKLAVIYARVSSKEQEKEGFSIPAQLKLLKEYASKLGFGIAREFVDVETAKQAGRTAFGELASIGELLCDHISRRASPSPPPSGRPFSGPPQWRLAFLDVL